MENNFRMIYNFEIVFAVYENKKFTDENLGSNERLKLVPVTTKNGAARQVLFFHQSFLFLISKHKIVE